MRPGGVPGISILRKRPDWRSAGKSQAGSGGDAPALAKLSLKSQGEFQHQLRCLLAEREREHLDAGIEEFDLEGHVFDRPLLPDQLIHPRFPNLARAIGAGIGAMIAARRGAVQRYLEANGRPLLRWT